MKVAVVKETGPSERRVALVPEAVAKLRSAGHEVLVESGAGEGAFLPDDAYSEAGATVVAAEQLAAADAILMVGRPDTGLIGRLRPGQAIFGLLAPLTDPALVRQLAETGATVVSLDLIPRTLSRAQPMDALTSQANIAGYKAVLLAAAEFGRFFPLLITAAGTARPAKVLILGTGVAGLQAIGTARRLGAVVSAYDVRPATKTEVESLGGTFIELTSVSSAAGTGGYARALTEAERDAQQAELADHIARHDVVITTAQVPGRRPPVLVTGDALKSMAPGSVIVDMGASPLGGNVEGSVAGQTIVTENGVTIMGAENLPSTMAASASTMYARNVSSLLTYMVSDGAFTVNLGDDLVAGVVVAHGGAVVHPALAQAPATAEQAESPAPPAAAAADGEAGTADPNQPAGD
ncbi:MAG: Re/Si-specific NAD(P)(+) transhydrogenase subunit alpha [Streptosporangiaceae bacterium]